MFFKNLTHYYYYLLSFFIIICTRTQLFCLWRTLNKANKTTNTKATFRGSLYGRRTEQIKIRPGGNNIPSPPLLLLLVLLLLEPFSMEFLFVLLLLSLFIFILSPVIFRSIIFLCCECEDGMKEVWWWWGWWALLYFWNWIFVDGWKLSATWWCVW